MSAPIAARQMPARVVPGRLVVHDRAANEWLALEQAWDFGALTWVVAGRHVHRARAEHAAGFHDVPPVRWMLRDPALGWRRRGGSASMHAPSPATQFDEATALAIAAAEPALELYVIRANGLITCPDIVAAP